MFYAVKVQLTNFIEEKNKSITMKRPNKTQQLTTFILKLHFCSNTNNLWKINKTSSQTGLQCKAYLVQQQNLELRNEIVKQNKQLNPAKGVQTQWEN